MEYCINYDLYYYLEIDHLPEPIVKFYTKQIIDFLIYCKEKNIVHRDIKLENILLDSEFNFKFGDFGYAKKIIDGSICNDYCGT